MCNVTVSPLGVPKAEGQVMSLWLILSQSLTLSLSLTPSLQGPEVPDVGHAGGDLSRVRHQVPPRKTLLQSSDCDGD